LRKGEIKGGKRKEEGKMRNRKKRGGRNECSATPDFPPRVLPQEPHKKSEGEDGWGKGRE